MLLVTSERFEEHVTPPGHPERMERARVFTAVADRRVKAGARAIAPRPATRDELARVHDAEHLDALATIAGRAVSLDADTYTSPESMEVAALAAGAAIQAAEHALAHGEAAFARHPPHRDRGYRRAPWQRVAVDVLRRPERALHLQSPVPVLSRDGRGR